MNRITRSITPIILSLALLVAAGFCQTLSAQDDFDLGIPGQEKTASAKPTASTPAAAPKGTTSTGEVNLFEMIKAGGWSMWVLGSFSIAVIGLAVFCLLDLQKKNFHPDNLVNALTAEMQSANFEGAVYQVQAGGNCLSSVMMAGLNLISDRGYEILDSEKLEETMAAASRKHNRGRVRTINYFSILAQAGPMMGLLGTVSGMIGAFGKLSQGGAGDPSVFAGDISEALITTASGLVVALPAIFCYFIFRDRLQQLAADCEEHAGDLTNTLRKAVTEGNGTEQG